MIDATDSPPTRSKRGRPRSLTEEQIVDAAVHLARSTRLESVSMRELADELGVPVMTIYNYVPNKEALYDLVSSSVLRGVRVPSPDEGTWEERLKQLERDVRRALVGLPRVVAGACAIRPRAPDSAEGVMSILASAGFGPTDAALAFAALFTFMVGQIDVDVEIAGSEVVRSAAMQGAAKATRHDT